ncbi:heme ABC transporter permease CcmC [Rhizomicrobium electricum]|uniref:Heme exporter protein C n=1 Tax=Rhizomicrobium electricum TaxID=480070 RepID=A0ABN1EY06_9PROT|nr:heme ABC transporter permease CcmC [Rhizomicrobium electricum]NIJ49952.1 heme exporter protein C [Rhizomicrobium electricum]
MLLGNPRRFLDATGKVLPWLAVATAVLFAVGIVLALGVPPDYQQGDTVRIMFLHVPAAWVAMMAYGLMALAGAVALVGRHPLADIAVKTAAPLGAVFTALGLVTGSLWGRPMWGAFWVWDGRLTSFLLLLFLYLGIVALANAIEDETRAARAAAVLAIVGAVNLPIIHFSVQWWATLHQGASILRQGGPAIAPVFLWPLGIMALAYTLLFATLWIVRIRTAILDRKANVLVATGRA